MDEGQRLVSRRRATGADTADVRAYLQSGDDPHRRVRVHARDNWREAVVTRVLVAGFLGVEPRSELGTVLADRLCDQLAGARFVVLYHRATSKALAVWLTRELVKRTTVERCAVEYVPDRQRRR